MSRSSPEDHETTRSRAWFIVGSAALMLALVMGTLVNGLTAFQVPIAVAEGWSRSGIAAINSFGLLGLATGSVFMGPMADRLGIRAICVIAASVMGLCLILASQAQALWQLDVLFFIAGALSGGALFAPLFATVGNWFPASAEASTHCAGPRPAFAQPCAGGTAPFRSTIMRYCSGSRWRAKLKVVFL